jgi:hypothetical protein
MDAAVSWYSCSRLVWFSEARMKADHAGAISEMTTFP